MRVIVDYWDRYRRWRPAWERGELAAVRELPAFPFGQACTRSSRAGGGESSELVLVPGCPMGKGEGQGGGGPRRPGDPPKYFF